MSSIERIEKFLIWFLSSHGNKFLGQECSNEIRVETAISNTQYSIIINDSTYSIISGVSATINEILTAIEVEILAGENLTTSVISDVLTVSDLTGKYFSIESDNFWITNKTGITTIYNYNNAIFDETLADQRPGLPFFTFRESTVSASSQSKVLKQSGDEYTKHSTTIIEVDIFSDDRNYKDMLNYILTSIKFDVVRMEMRREFLGLIGASPQVTDVSYILGGSSELRANTTINIASCDTVIDDSINPIITVEVDTNVNDKNEDKLIIEI